jgi:hypothetical protein
LERTPKAPLNEGFRNSQRTPKAPLNGALLLPGRLLALRDLLALLALLLRGDLLLLLLRVDALHPFLVDQHARATAQRGANCGVRAAAAEQVAGYSAGGAADEAALLVGAQRVRSERRRGERGDGGETYEMAISWRFLRGLE